MIGIVNLPLNPYSEFFQGRKVLVTGAAGHLGSQLVKQLIAYGTQVAILVRSSTDLWRIKGMQDICRVYHGDIQRLDIAALQEQVPTVDTLYHLAAQGVNPQQQNVPLMMETNIGGTLNALELARCLKVRRFIYCGSCFEYGRGECLNEDNPLLPISEYGMSKAAGWILVNTFFRKYGLPVVSLRPFTLYGPYEAKHRLIPFVMSHVLECKDIDLTDGDQARDWVYVDDAVEAFLKAAMVEAIEGQTFNVATGRSTTVKEVVAMILGQMNTSVNLKWGALPKRVDELGVVTGCTAKAQQSLHWQAQTALPEGLAKTICWFKDNRHKYLITDKADL